MAFDPQKYKDDYNEANYDRLTVRVPKGKRKVLQEYAAQHGTSVNAMVIQALETQFKLNLSKE